MEHVRTTDPVRDLPERLVPFLRAARAVALAVLHHEDPDRREAVLYLLRGVGVAPEVHAMRRGALVWWLRHQQGHVTGKAAADAIEEQTDASLLPIAAVPPTGEVLVHWVRACS